MKLINLFLLLIAILSFQPAFCGMDSNQSGSNLRPLSFGDDQIIIDLKKVIWKPLKVTGLPAGAEIAILRGSLETGTSESLLRLPPGYNMPVHNHTSDELYVWIEGAFTLIAHDQTKIKFDGPAYISFPGNTSPHGLKCGLKKACVLYLRLSRPFDIKYFPSTQQKSQ
ncbi:MAG: DUF4437 domain-containing protein [Methylococcales bacterium]